MVRLTVDGSVVLMTARRRPGGEDKQSSQSLLDELFAPYGAHLTVADVMAILGIKKSRAYKWLDEGTIPAYRAGGGWVILASEVKAWMRSQANAVGDHEASSAAAGAWGRVGAPASANTAQRALSALLPSFNVEPDEASLWWVGAHGGAGETTLEAVIGMGTKAAAHRWPATPADEDPASVIVVARTNLNGLTLALRALAASQEHHRHQLLGAVLIADAPGPMPPKLQWLLNECAEQVAQAWTLPWMEPWRTETVTKADLPDAYRQLIDDIDELVHQRSHEEAGVS